MRKAGLPGERLRFIHRQMNQVFAHRQLLTEFREERVLGSFDLCDELLAGSDASAGEGAFREYIISILIDDIHVLIFLLVVIRLVKLNAKKMIRQGPRVRLAAIPVLSPRAALVSHG